jgi:hypothetical protein
LRWLEDLEEDLRETTVKIRRQKAADKEELASVIKEAKAVRGPQSQGVFKYVEFPCDTQHTSSRLTSILIGQYVKNDAVNRNVLYYKNNTSLW